MKKYWYIFFSIPAYFFLVGHSQYRVFSFRKKLDAKDFKNIRKGFLGNVFLTWGGVLMLSSVLFQSIVPYNITVGGTSLVVFWIYIAGILATYIHACWREKIRNTYCEKGNDT